MTNERRDAKLSGSGVLSGGSYDHVSISGSGRINGDVEAETVKISGSCKMDGNVEAGEFKVSGSGKLEGSLSGKRLKVSGSFRVGDELDVVEINSSGTLSCGSHLKTETVKISGSLKVGGNMQAEDFQIDGTFAIEGELNANNVDARLSGPSRVREIGGESIRIRDEGFSSFFLRPLLFWIRRTTHMCEAETIEGTTIYIENTRARTVRGHDVQIGPGCQIGHVEYTGTLEVSPEASVGEQIAG
ncbi:hypothetical protein J31TS4_12410 [Paenibacillus sp. J31TS4]|uniref:polymer-forming cytoskeletal protein n=1 Tax=Paenibacillus sp. J31TS4 TaxID=2807195 RepID=UPI001B0B6E24|nr:polymer-forming cytoskeletal protein [Paenibacillus sp. J31TS4]GIP37961.1 hypothetical protein J31TS4_12410 [Paenibacillus sp. J31TS4]